MLTSLLVGFLAADLLEVALKQGKLLEEIVFLDAHRTFEEAGQVLQQTHLAATLSEQRKPEIGRASCRERV